MINRLTTAALLFITLLTAPAFAQPERNKPVASPILITEIMYNPDSPEGSEGIPAVTEWVEIYNSADRPANLSGCYLQDEDGATAPFPRGAILKPKQVLILVPGETNPAEFKAAWGKDLLVLPLQNWNRTGIGGLANSPDEQNEWLVLRDRAGNILDEVNYDDEGDWPSDSPDGPSIYLLPGKIDSLANDDGKNWARSTPEKHGAKQVTPTANFTGEDIGSPGIVLEKEPEQKDADTKDKDKKPAE